MQACQAGQDRGEGISVGDQILTKVIYLQNHFGFLQSFLIKAEHPDAGCVGWYAALDAHDSVNADFNNFKDFEIVKEKSDTFSGKNLHSKKRIGASSKKEYSISTINRFSCLDNELDNVLSEERAKSTLNQTHIGTSGLETTMFSFQTTRKNKSRPTRSHKLILTMESIHTGNQFDVLRDLEESEIDEIIGLHPENVEITTKKQKCKTCGYKTNCHLQSECRSYGMCCYACNKKNHLPKSRNCAMRKKKFRMSQNNLKIKENCITL